MDTSTSTTSVEVVIAMGGNVGDRVGNISKGLELMQKAGVVIKQHGCLYESVPAYFTDQPFFLNTAILAETTLPAQQLLRVLKQVESDLGRDFHGIRNGPRPLDLDIIFYGTQVVDTGTLQIPHPRLTERPFVLAPLVDLLGEDGDRLDHWSTHPSIQFGVSKLWSNLGGEDSVGTSELQRVLPIGSHLWAWNTETHVMGILNVTPDSFSDGGKYQGITSAIEHAEKMVDDGAQFIDVGGQSTRPGAKLISTEEEMARSIPIIEALSSNSKLEKSFISIDTFDSKVAEAAIAAGAHIVNDVSAGQFDHAMIQTIAKLQVPYIMMHMRGDPTTMGNCENTSYNDVCTETGEELSLKCQNFEFCGLPAWKMMIDPGFGFAKTHSQNFELIRGLPKFRERVAYQRKALGFMPMVVGPSRKGFLGNVTGRSTASDRDWATCAAAVACVLGGANVIRAHNVRAIKDAVKVADAIFRFNL